MIFRLIADLILPGEWVEVWRWASLMDKWNWHQDSWSWEVERMLKELEGMGWEGDE